MARQLKHETKEEVMTKNIDIQNTPKAVLEQIVALHGIDIVKNFIKEHNKQLRKKSTRVNYYEDVACEVYQLMYKYRYSKTRAIDEVAENRNINSHTVRNHCAKFDKEAKKFDFYSFGVLTERVEYVIGDIISTLKTMSEKNNLSYEVARTYYDMYLNYPRKKEIPQINMQHFNAPYGVDKDKDEITF